MIPSPEPLKSNLNLRESIFPVLCAPTKTQITDAGENFIDAGAKSYAAGTNITDAGGNFIDAGAKNCVARSNIIDAGAKSYVAGTNITDAGAKSYLARSIITDAGAKSYAPGGKFTGARTPNLWPQTQGIVTIRRGSVREFTLTYLGQLTPSPAPGHRRPSKTPSSPSPGCAPASN